MKARNFIPFNYRKRSGKYNNIKCVLCGKNFHVTPSRLLRIGNKKAKYCSMDCKIKGTKNSAITPCAFCGKGHKSYGYAISVNKNNFCGNECKLAFQRMENHPRWKGGQFTDSQGYIVIRNEKYPKGIYEHRLLMEEKFGRRLRGNEYVHHLNEVKVDNRLENLVVLSNGDHIRRFHFNRIKSNGEIPRLRRKLIRIFNAWIRNRDKNNGCISCGGPVEQAGHFWSTSQCPKPSMRFNEKNVNGQCIRCNHFLEGNRQGYESGLIKKYGEEIIQELELCKNLNSNPWTPFEYQEAIKKYKVIR